MPDEANPLAGGATGLLAPTEGSISVLGRDPLRDPGVLAEVGYVAQGAPLYRSFSVAETIEFARRTNTRWDDEAATDLLTRIDPRTKVGSHITERSLGHPARCLRWWPSST